MGTVVRPAARAVFCMGRSRDEEEEGLGDVGSSSNRLKWLTDPNDKSHATCMQTCRICFLFSSSLVSTVCSLSGRGAGTSAVDSSIGPVLLNDFALQVGLP